MEDATNLAMMKLLEVGTRRPIAGSIPGQAYVRFCTIVLPPNLVVELIVEYIGSGPGTIWQCFTVKLNPGGKLSHLRLELTGELLSPHLLTLLVAPSISRHPT